MAWCVDLRAATGDGPTAIQRLEAISDPREILSDRQITARQLLQSSYPALSVIDRFEMLEAQQFGQLAGVNLVTLAALFQQSILTRITHQHFRDMRLQQVIQPGCPGSFFEGDMQISAQTVDELQNRVRFRLYNALHHNLALSVPYRNRNRFLVNIHPDILRVQHRVLLPVGDDPNTQNLLQKGRPFIMRALTGKTRWIGSRDRNLSLQRGSAGRQGHATNVKMFSQLWTSTAVLVVPNGGARGSY